MEWKIRGDTREALVCIPEGAKTNVCPIILGFHGHGGTARNAARTFDFHQSWPQAIVIYMQGLKTPGRLTDPKGQRAGWQSLPGEQEDRDLEFFDAVLEKIEKDFRADTKKIFAAGHSNGGSFVYLLWAMRGERLAAVAPSGAVAVPSIFRKLKPKPVFHVAGEADPLVRFAWQKRTIEEVRRLNECEPGRQTAKYCTSYLSKISAPVMTYIHPGGHEFRAEAAAEIVKFFQDYNSQ